MKDTMDFKGRRGILQPARKASRVAGLFLWILAAGGGVGIGPFCRVASGADITLDAVTSSGEGSGTSFSWSHTVGAGVQRMLVVGVGIESSTDRPVSSITYGTKALTLVPGSRALAVDTKVNATELWYLPAPPAGTALITVTFSGSLGTGGGAAGGAVSLFGVNQGAPEAVSALAGQNTDGLYSLSVTTKTDRAWLIDVVNNGEKTLTNFVPGTNQTERWDLLGNGQFRLAGSTREVMTAGTVTDSWMCVTNGNPPSREAQSIAAFTPVKPPTVAITSPLDGETVSRVGFVIAVEASGGVGVTNVEFFADGNLLGSDAVAPYAWTWTSVALGDHTLTARATDAAGVQGTSATVTVHVVSNLPPRVSFTYPVNGTAVGTNITLAATASDDVSVARVDFFDGATPIGSDATAPYTYPWGGSTLGAHTLYAVAWDNAGLASTSTVTVVVIVQRAPYVIVISVDGMGSEYVKPLLADGLANELTTFKRIQAEGSGTLNARDDAHYAITLPNHVTMMTGRGVAGVAGHNWTDNGDPLPTDTIHSNKGSYVASAFDVAHDNGLRTAIWSGKSKFNLFQQSYGPDTGAMDETGPDNGRDKIDYDRVTIYMPAAPLTDEFTNRMAATPFHFVFFHYQDPDSAGHAYGWSTNPASPYAATLKSVDTQIGNILRMVTSHPEMKGRTAIILTSDHGGHDYTHGDTTNPLDFTVPFYVWGAGVAAGSDLYVMNPTSRTAPAPTANPPYTGSQPVRNGDAANLALDLLGLGPVPGSSIGTAQNLLTDTPLAAPLAIRMDSGRPVVEWPGTNVWLYTVEFKAALADRAPWTYLSDGWAIPGANSPMSATDTNGPSEGVYRIRMVR